VACLLALVVGPSPVGRWMAGLNLSVHMLIEHTALLGAGALGALALVRLAGAPRPHPLVAAAMIAAAFGVIGVWHVPSAFDETVRSSAVHAVMHLSYLGAGAALAWGLSGVGSVGRLAAYAVVNGLMICLALAMISGDFVYLGYSVGASRTVGVAMYLGMQLLTVALVAGRRVGWVWRSWRVAPASVVALAAVLLVSILVAH